MSTSVTFINATPLTVDVFWRNFEGEEVRYNTLGPATRYEQQTYEGHVWILRDARSGEHLAEMAALAEPSDFVVTAEDVVSTRAGAAVSIDFRNETALAVGVYWINGKGEEKLYANLRPGESYRQSTVEHHVWVTRSLHCGSRVGLYIPDAAPQQSYDIALISVQGRTPITATFQNTTALSVEVVWLDDEGQLVIYHKLAPGAKAVQPTFAGHPWLVRDARSKTILQVMPSLHADAVFAISTDKVHSLPGTKDSRTHFRNLCAVRAELFWIGFDGSETSFAKLSPGAQATIDTFAGHAWRLRRQHDGSEVSVVIASATSDETRDFTPQPVDGKVVTSLHLSNNAMTSLEGVVAGPDGTMHRLIKLGHGASGMLRLLEGTELVLRDAGSGLILRRVTGTAIDQTIDMRPRDVRSTPGTASVSVKFTNKTPFDVDVFWVDFEGKERKYARLSSGQDYEQGTGVHHVWRGRERFSGKLVGIYAASPDATQAMAFTMSSLESRTPTGITFENTTRLTTDVYWMDFDGNEKLYATLKPGGSIGFQTFATHPWIVRDQKSGRVLDWTWGDRRDARIVLDDADLKPREGEVPIKAVFKNKLGWAVDLFWLNYQGEEVYYATLNPGQQKTMNTFETHPWRVRQAQSGDEIAMFIASGKPTQNFNITLKSKHGKVPTQVTFANTSPLTLDVFWIDYQGQEKRYATIAPHEEYTQDTYMTHPWVVRDKNSGEAVGYTVATRMPQMLFLTGAPTRSRDGVKTQLIVTNPLTIRTDVYWIDREGEEISYGTLEPGGVLNLGTLAGHAWRMRETESQAEIDLYIANSLPVQAYFIKNNLVRTKERKNAELWPGEVAFYEHEDFKGKVWILSNDTPDFRRIAGMNDKVSSVRVGPDTAVTVFKHVAYKGTNDVLYMDTPALRETDVGNDQISSMSLIDTPPLEAGRLSSTSRLTEDMTMRGREIVRTPVLRSMITLPAMTGMVDVWATEEVTIRSGGRSHVIDPVRPARLRGNDMGKLEILLDPEAIGGGALMLRTSAMAERERMFVFPDVDLHSKILAMDDDALWKDRETLGLRGDLSEQDAVHAGRALKSLSSSVPAAFKSLSHGTSQDRRIITDRMTYDNWALELGGDGPALFRPASRAEIAAAGATAIDLNGQDAQGFFDFIEDAAGSVGNFFVETIPAAATSVANEIEDFVVEDVGGALEDAGEAIVKTVEPIGREIAKTAELVWDETKGWVEQAATDVVETIGDGVDAVVKVASDVVDTFEEVASGVVQGLAKAAEAVLRVTMEVGGKIYRFVADTVEVIGKVVRKVLDGIGVALGKLVRAFMDVFGLDGFIETHDAIIEKINEGIDLAEASVKVLQRETASFLSNVQDQIVEGIDAAIDQAGGGDIAQANRDRPADRSKAIDQLDWLMSKLVGDGGDGGGGGGPSPAQASGLPSNPIFDQISSAMPGAQTKDLLAKVIEPLIDKLTEFIDGDFGIVMDAIGDSLALFSAAISEPSKAPGYILSGALSLIKGLLVTGISFIEAVADLLFDLFLGLLEMLQKALNVRIDIPFLTAFYEAMTGREFSAISMVAFFVAIPASIIGKLTLGRSLFQNAGAAQSDTSDDGTGLSAQETVNRQVKREWAIVYGVCHVILNGFDLFYDISGAKIKTKKEPDQTEMRTFEVTKWRTHVNRAGKKRRHFSTHRVERPVQVPGLKSKVPVFDPAPTSSMGIGMCTARLGIMGAVILAQIAGNPTGSINGMHPDEMGKALQGKNPDGSPMSAAEAERAKYGVIVWSYQWIYLLLSSADFATAYAGSLGVKSSGMDKATTYGLPVATTIVGLVHLGLMSKYVNTDFHAEEWSTGGSDYDDETLGRRRFSWLMDTFPAVTKVCAINELNEGTFYIPLGIHCVGFVTLGHLGEAITYFVRGGLEVDDEQFDL